MAESGTKLDVSCSICFEEYDTPKVLTCGHTFCCRCLNKMLDKHLMYLKCPKCRTEVPLPESGKIGDLPTNYELVAIIDDHIQEGNGKIGAIKKEEVQPEAVNQCLLHKKPLEFYCKSCKMQVCAQCLLSEHKPGEHDIVTKSDFAENLLVELTKLKEKLHDFKKKENSFGDKITESEISLEQQYSKIQAEINSKVAQEQEKIKTKGDILLKELADKKAASLCLFTDLKTQHSSLSSLYTQTEEKCTLLGKEFINVNITGEGELAEISKGIDNLNTQIQSLGKTCDKTTKTEEVDFNFHDVFQWDLGKLITTADAEKLNKAAGGGTCVNCNHKNKNRVDDEDDYRDDYEDDYDRDDYRDEYEDDYRDDYRDDDDNEADYGNYYEEDYGYEYEDNLMDD